MLLSKIPGRLRGPRSLGCRLHGNEGRQQLLSLSRGQRTRNFPDNREGVGRQANCGLTSPPPPLGIRRGSGGPVLGGWRLSCMCTRRGSRWVANVLAADA
eukprot:7385822-Pyramimonas_sp.AAC.2